MRAISRCGAEESSPAAIRIPAACALEARSAPFAILAQIHGNEPAGLAGILLAMALAEAGKLERDVIGVIGNPLAAEQYFERLGKRAERAAGNARRLSLRP